MKETYLKIQDIKFWARVGVLNNERQFGQLFSLDVCLWSDFEGQPMSILEGVADGLLPLVSPNCNLPFDTMNFFGLGNCKNDADLKTIFHYFLTCIFYLSLSCIY